MVTAAQILQLIRKIDDRKDKLSAVCNFAKGLCKNGKLDPHFLNNLNNIELLMTNQKERDRVAKEKYKVLVKQSRIRDKDLERAVA
jgi:hypothetical protein